MICLVHEISLLWNSIELFDFVLLVLVGHIFVLFDFLDHVKNVEIPVQVQDSHDLVLQIAVSPLGALDDLDYL